jgi:hypothetical protein
LTSSDWQLNSGCAYTKSDSRFVARGPAVYPDAVIVAAARAVRLLALPVMTSAKQGGV